MPMSSSSSERLDAHLLDRYLAGEAMPDEIAEVERAIERSVPLRDAVAEVRRAPLFVEPAERAPNVRRGRALIDRYMDDMPASRRVASPRLGSSPLRRPAMGIAAMLALVGVVGSIRSRVHSSPMTTRRYTTGTGQRATVELADGSRIILAPRTQLILTNGANGREVSLVGEAHFDVISSARVPFVVRTGAVTTRVLGTTFEVRRYPGDRLGRVLVFSGKVATAGRNAPVTLTAGMIGEFTDSSVVARATTDAATYTDWTNGQLVFRKVPVPAALATLTRWYGYQFRLGDSTLAADSVTAVFRIGETGEMMRRLQHLLGVNMTFDDSVVTLRPTTGRAADPTVHHNSHHLPLSPSTEVGR